MVSSTKGKYLLFTVFHSINTGCTTEDNDEILRHHPVFHVDPIVYETSVSFLQIDFMFDGTS